MMGELPPMDSSPEIRRDAGAVFVLESKGDNWSLLHIIYVYLFSLFNAFLSCRLLNLKIYLWMVMKREMVARRVSSDDGDSGPDDTDAAVRIQGIGMGFGVLLFDGYGSGDLLLLLSHVEGAWPLWERGSPAYPIPWTCRRRLRWQFSCFLLMNIPFS